MPETTQSQTPAQPPTRQQYESYASRYYAQYGKYPPNHEQYMAYYNKQLPPEPDPDKPVQGKPAPVHHALDHHMIIPIVVIIFLVLAGGVGYSVYSGLMAGEEESYTAAEAAPTTAAPAEITETATETAAAETIAETELAPAAVTVPDTCFDMEYESEKDECYTNLALTSFDDDFCDEINLSSGKGSRDECYHKMAISTYTVDYCNMMGQVSGEVSVDACYLELAIKLEVPDLCFYVSDVADNAWSADACFTRMAQVMDDDVLCGFVYTQKRDDGSYSAEECLAQFGMSLEDFENKYFGG